MYVYYLIQIFQYFHIRLFLHFCVHRVGIIVSIEEVPIHTLPEVDQDVGGGGGDGLADSPPPPFWKMIL